MAAKHYSNLITKAPNTFLCPLHLLPAVKRLHILSTGYAQLALGDCLVTAVLTRQTSSMQEVSSSSSVQQSTQMWSPRIQKSFKRVDAPLPLNLAVEAQSVWPCLTKPVHNLVQHSFFPQRNRREKGHLVIWTCLLKQTLPTFQITEL